MPKLVIKEGPGRGDQFEIRDSDVTIGRDADSTVRLPDRTVSRQHARVAKQGGRCYVSDLGSHNGTLVNAERVESKRLYHMDEIRLGNVMLIFLEDDVTDVDMLIHPLGEEPPPVRRPLQARGHLHQLVVPSGQLYRATIGGNRYGVPRSNPPI